MGFVVFVKFLGIRDSVPSGNPETVRVGETRRA